MLRDLRGCILIAIVGVIALVVIYFVVGSPNPFATTTSVNYGPVFQLGVVQQKGILDTASVDVPAEIDWDSHNQWVGIFNCSHVRKSSIVRVDAGVDFSDFRDNDFERSGNAITVSLPSAVVVATTTLQTQTDTGNCIIPAGDTDRVSDALSIDVANYAAKQAVEQLGLLTKAQQNAETPLRQLLYQMKFTDVAFIYGANANPTPIPTPPVSR